MRDIIYGVGVYKQIVPLGRNVSSTSNGAKVDDYSVIQTGIHTFRVPTAVSESPRF